MKSSYATGHKPTEDEDRHAEVSLPGAQRLMFTGYWEWNLKTRRYSWSDEMYRIFNVAPQPLLLRTGTFFNGVHPEDREEVVKALGNALVGSQPYDIEHRIVWPDGSVRLVHGKADVTFDKGRPIRILGTIQDITDRRQVVKL